VYLSTLLSLCRNSRCPHANQILSKLLYCVERRAGPLYVVLTGSSIQIVPQTNNLICHLATEARRFSFLPENAAFILISCYLLLLCFNTTLIPPDFVTEQNDEWNWRTMKAPTDSAPTEVTWNGFKVHSPCFKHLSPTGGYKPGLPQDKNQMRCTGKTFRGQMSLQFLSNSQTWTRIRTATKH
jgi:hypothetical protein